MTFVNATDADFESAIRSNELADLAFRGPIFEKDSCFSKPLYVEQILPFPGQLDPNNFNAFQILKTIAS
jgi:hypothetical protein